MSTHSGMSTARIRRVVVVGNGIAGLTAADTLREAGYDGALSIIGDEPHPAYSRPALSKALLLDGRDQPSTAHTLPPPTHGAEEMLGVRATGLDPDRRLLTLSDGTTLPYDRLVLAAGSHARRLSQHPDELTLRGLDDALALRARLAGRPSVAVIGGGPLGMEVASAALAAGCRVTLVCAGHGPPLIAQLGEYLAGVFTAAAIEHGLHVVPTGAASLAYHGGEARVCLAEGGVVDAELVITAIGDVPNTGWLAGTGLPGTAGGALEADEHGRVRHDIVAAGDLAAIPTPRGVRRLPFWTSAIEQAKVAARALIEGAQAAPLRYEPYFWTEQFGRQLKVVGDLPVDGPPEYVDRGPGGGALLRWTRADGSAVAAALDYRIPVPRLRRLSRGAA